MITAVDLFSGCGGLSLGFQQAGFDILAAIDNWNIALDVYRENFNHPAIQQDLSGSSGFEGISKTNEKGRLII
jgi:DNA (cytosine-5)-methyltransferase 1